MEQFLYVLNHRESWLVFLGDFLRPEHPMLGQPEQPVKPPVPHITVLHLHVVIKVALGVFAFQFSMGNRLAASETSVLVAILGEMPSSPTPQCCVE